MTELEALPHVVYRCYNAADRLLYVGCTYNFEQRWKQHTGNRRRFVPLTARVLFQHFPDRESARECETTAICTEWPRYNRYPKFRSRRPFGPITEREYDNEHAWRLLALIQPKALSWNYYEKRGHGRRHHYADERLMTFAACRMWPHTRDAIHAYRPGVIPEGTYWRLHDAA